MPDLTIEKQIKDNIDWLNQEDNPPSRASSYLHPVSIGMGMFAIRGFTGSRSCLYYATMFALAGQNNDALTWLQAGQDHNQSVQKMFADNLEYCVEYMKATYGRAALESFGIGMTLQQVLSVIGAHNPNPSDAPLDPTSQPAVFNENNEVPDHREHGGGGH